MIKKRNIKKYIVCGLCSSLIVGGLVSLATSKIFNANSLNTFSANQVSGDDLNNNTRSTDDIDLINESTPSSDITKANSDTTITGRTEIMAGRICADSGGDDELKPESTKEDVKAYLLRIQDRTSKLSNGQNGVNGGVFVNITMNDLRNYLEVLDYSYNEISGFAYALIKLNQIYDYNSQNGKYELRKTNSFRRIIEIPIFYTDKLKETPAVFANQSYTKISNNLAIIKLEQNYREKEYDNSKQPLRLHGKASTTQAYLNIQNKPIWLEYAPADRLRPNDYSLQIYCNNQYYPLTFQGKDEIYSLPRAMSSYMKIIPILDQNNTLCEYFIFPPYFQFEQTGAIPKCFYIFNPFTKQLKNLEAIQDINSSGNQIIDCINRASVRKIETGEKAYYSFMFDAKFGSNSKIISCFAEDVTELPPGSKVIPIKKFFTQTTYNNTKNNYITYSNRTYGHIYTENQISNATSLPLIYDYNRKDLEKEQGRVNQPIKNNGYLFYNAFPIELGSNFLNIDFSDPTNAKLAFNVFSSKIAANYDESSTNYGNYYINKQELVLNLNTKEWSSINNPNNVRETKIKFDNNVRFNGFYFKPPKNAWTEYYEKPRAIYYANSYNYDYTKYIVNLYDNNKHFSFARIIDLVNNTYHDVKTEKGLINLDNSNNHFLKQDEYTMLFDSSLPNLSYYKISYDRVNENAQVSYNLWNINALPELIVNLNNAASEIFVKKFIDNVDFLTWFKQEYLIPTIWDTFTKSNEFVNFPCTSFNQNNLINIPSFDASSTMMTINEVNNKTEFDIYFSADAFNNDGSIEKHSYKITVKLDSKINTSNVTIKEDIFTNLSFVEIKNKINAINNELASNNVEATQKYFNVSENNYNAINEALKITSIYVVNDSSLVGINQIAIGYDVSNYFVKEKNSNQMNFLKQFKGLKIIEVSNELATDISLPQTISAQNSSFATYNSYQFATNFMNETNQTDTITSWILNNIINKINENITNESQKYSMDDIALSKNAQYNTSKGEAYIVFSIPKINSWNNKLTINNLRSINATSVVAINDSINASIRSNIVPSKLQEWLNEKFNNIYYLVNIISGYWGSSDGARTYYFPYIFNDGSYINNSNYNQTKVDKTTANQIKEFNKTMTNLTGNVLEYDDIRGTATVEVLVYNFYSNQDNVPFLDTSANPKPNPYTVQKKNVEIRGLKSKSIITDAKESIATTQGSMIPYQFVNEKQTQGIKQLLIDQVLINPPANPNINIISITPDNKKGNVYVQYELLNALTTDHQTIDYTNYYTTKITGFTPVTSSKLEINQNGYNLGTESFSNKIISCINPDGSLNTSNEETFNLINGLLVRKGNFPPDTFNNNQWIGLKGNITNINFDQSTATINLIFKSYYDGFYRASMINSYSTNLCVTLEIATRNKTIYVKNSSTYSLDQNNNYELLKTESFNSIEDPIVIAKKDDNHILVNSLIITGTIIGLILILSLGYLQMRNKKK